jgi:hypothetical protein
MIVPVSVAASINYRCSNGRSWLSAHGYQVPTPTSQNLGVKQRIRIFGIKKLRITNVSMLELFHQERTNSSVDGKIEIHNF